MEIHVGDEIYRRAAEIAAEENVSVDQIFTSAFEQRLIELERLKQRGSRGSHEKFLKVMEKVPDVEPEEYDQLCGAGTHLRAGSAFRLMLLA